jgi:hypothetical protein
VAEICGCSIEVRRIFNVIPACGKSLSQKCNGKVGSTEERPVTKFSLKGSDGAFGSVASMAMMWHQLVSDIVDGKEILQGDGCLVAESLELWFETLDRELLMDGVICFDPLRG